MESLLRLGQRSVRRRRGDGRPLPGPAGVAASTLTKESAQLAGKYGLRNSSKTSLSTGVLKGNSGQIRGFVQFAGPGSLLTNPALLAGAAGIMAQVACRRRNGPKAFTAAGGAAGVDGRRQQRRYLPKVATEGSYRR